MGNVEISVVKVTNNGIDFGEWSSGPQLEQNTAYGQLVVSKLETAFFWVGGYFRNGTNSDRVYKLSWAKEEIQASEWSELPHKMLDAEFQHTSLLIPSEYMEYCAAHNG